MKTLGLIFVLITLSFSAFSAERCGCTARDEAFATFHGTSNFSVDQARSNALTMCEMRTQFPGTCKVFGHCGCIEGLSEVKNLKSADTSHGCNARDEGYAMFYGRGNSLEEAQSNALNSCDYRTQFPGTCQLFSCD